MTDSEIIAYNAGVKAYLALGDVPFTPDDLQRSLVCVADDRDVEAAHRLGEDLFFSWVTKGAWDARAGSVR